MPMTDDKKRQLGKIEKVRIGLDRDCFLTFWMHFDFGGSGQGFGGYILDEWNAVRGEREGTAAGTDAIRQLMVLFHVDDFYKIAGRTAYALRESDSWSEPIVGVEVPKFDAPRNGPSAFLISEWRARWFPEVTTCR